MNYSLLNKTLLFRGITENEIKTMLQCLGAYTKTYEKNETIYHTGDTVDYLGVVLSGSVNIENYDVWGNRSIVSHAGVGQLFAEIYAFIPGEQLMTDVSTNEKTEVLFLYTSRLVATCSKACSYHTKLIKNLMQIMAQKNLTLLRRTLHTSPKSIRGRLMSYFSECVKQKGNYSFTIPFNRQQLADYLSVDRSAMSNELSKMQREGILIYKKNTFEFKEIVNE